MTKGRRPGDGPFRVYGSGAVGADRLADDAGGEGVGPGVDVGVELALGGGALLGDLRGAGGEDGVALGGASARAAAMAAEPSSTALERMRAASWRASASSASYCSRTRAASVRRSSARSVPPSMASSRSSSVRLIFGRMPFARMRKVMPNNTRPRMSSAQTGLSGPRSILKICEFARVMRAFYLEQMGANTAPE